MSKVKFVSTGKNPYVLNHVSAETKPGEFISSSKMGKTQIPISGFRRVWMQKK